MELKDLNRDLVALKRDYDSCPFPSWQDTSTVSTLNNIIKEIKLGRLSMNDFNQFVTLNLGQGDFAWGCRQYVQEKSRHSYL